MFQCSLKQTAEPVSCGCRNTNLPPQSPTWDNNEQKNKHMLKEDRKIYIK